MTMAIETNSKWFFRRVFLFVSNLGSIAVVGRDKKLQQNIYHKYTQFWIIGVGAYKRVVPFQEREKT